MQVVVTAGSGALGQALVRALAGRGALTRADGAQAPIGRVIAVDRSQSAALFLDPRVEYVRGDYEQPRFLARMMEVCTDSVFHVSVLGAGTQPDGSDADLDTALGLSLDTTRALLEACSFQSHPPRVVYASLLDAAWAMGARPAGSDAACAALGELLLIEGCRRGQIDLRCVRLPRGPGDEDAIAAALIEAHERPAGDDWRPMYVDFFTRP